MKEKKQRAFAPSYYPAFHCIADKCSHTCCACWEVGIDAKTLKKYKKLDTPLGMRIKNHIAEDKEGARFALLDERCPMLSECGLCDIITELGEEYIPEICRLHPRFKNVLSDRCEIGLGLCCEEVARLVISQKEPFSLIEINGFEAQSDNRQDSKDESLICESTEPKKQKFEAEMLAIREKIFSLIYTKSTAKSVLSDIKDLAALSDFCPEEHLCLFSELEYMSDAFRGKLSQLTEKEKSGKPSKDVPLGLPLRNIFSYLAFRYLTPAEDRAELRARVALLLLSSTLLLFLGEGLCEEELSELARLYSSEVEYSEENMEILLSNLDFEVNF